MEDCQQMTDSEMEQYYKNLICKQKQMTDDEKLDFLKRLQTEQSY